MAQTIDHPNTTTYASMPDEKQTPLLLDAVKTPIGILSDQTTDSETRITIQEGRNLVGPSDFTASRDSSALALTAHGKQVPFSKRREIRDASGQPILVLHVQTTTFKSAWYADIPGRSGEHVIDVDLHGALSEKNSIDVRFRNVMADDDSTASLEPKETILEVRGRDHERTVIDIFHHGARVAHIKKMPKPISAAQNTEPATFEVTVSANVDLAVIMVSVIALSDTMSNRFHSGPAYF